MWLPANPEPEPTQIRCLMRQQRKAIMSHGLLAAQLAVSTLSRHGMQRVPLPEQVVLRGVVAVCGLHAPHTRVHPV